jgi:hypothetical protein
MYFRSNPQHRLSLCRLLRIATRLCAILKIVINGFMKIRRQFENGLAMEADAVRDAVPLFLLRDS